MLNLKINMFMFHFLLNIVVPKMLSEVDHSFLVMIWKRMYKFILHLIMCGQLFLLILLFSLTFLNHVKDIKDPKHPYSLEELKVIIEDAIDVDDQQSYVR